MKCTRQLFSAYAVAAAATICGCATPSLNTPPAGLPAQQLHNVARPTAKKSWLPKMMQPQAGQPKSPASKSPTLSDNIANSLPSQGKASKPTDPLTMARLQERRGQTEQAVQLYEAELQKQPNNAKIHHRLAVIAARSGQWEKADGHFRAATTLDPNNAELLCDCGYALYLQHQLPEAEACLRTAVEVNPNHKAAYNNLGIVLGVQGKFEESLTVFRQGGSEAEAHANLGYVYMQLGDVDGAMAELNHALSLDSKLRNAALALIQLNDLKHRFAPKVIDDTTQIAEHQVEAAEDSAGAVQEVADVVPAAPAIEIAAAPSLTTARSELQDAETTPSSLASHEPIDGSLTENRFRLARRDRDDAESPRPLRTNPDAPSPRSPSLRPLDATTSAGGSTPDGRSRASDVVQASAQLTPGQTISVRTLNDAEQSQSFPVRVYTPSARIQQARTNDRHPEASQSQPLVKGRGIESGTSHAAPAASPNASQPANTNAGLVGAVGAAQAAGAASAVVHPLPGDSPALVPQIRMPRPDELMPQQAHMSQLPTHQLHPTASATWSAPQTPTNNLLKPMTAESVAPARTRLPAN